ncbi:MAG TPA: hypothetical protein VL284_15540 [Thermoanaerobaculia bacterium]|nr:hypothetical protein [Thermoanaerobaculia bacterium]
MILILASAAVATWFEVSPPAPTPQTPVSITFTTAPMGDCGPTQSEVSIAGTNVHVRLYIAVRTPACVPTVVPRTIRVDIGTLPIGLYDLSADYNEIQWRGSFLVRSATTALAVTSTAGQLPVSIPNGANSVTIGGVPANLLKDPESGRTFALAPPHEPGLYNVSATDANGNALAVANPIDYFDPAAPPDLTVFERVLFPVLDSFAGANGSVWDSVATIENLGGDYVEAFNTIGTVPALRPPLSSFQFSGRGHPHGALLYIPRQTAMAFSLRVRDVASDDPGFEIVPVRESQFFRSPLTLANIPIGADYRTRLRIYGIDPLPDPEVSVASRVWSTTLKLQRGASIDQPAYAEVDLATIPQLRGMDSITLQIGGSGRIWAFASAVHTPTQRTIIIGPQ